MIYRVEFNRIGPIRHDLPTLMIDTDQCPTANHAARLVWHTAGTFLGRADFGVMLDFQQLYGWLNLGDLGTLLLIPEPEGKPIRPPEGIQYTIGRIGIEPGGPYRTDAADTDGDLR